MAVITARHKHFRVRSFAILWFVYAGYYLTRKNFAVAKSEIMDTYGLNTAQIGYIGGAFLAMYAIGQFVNGMLGDRVGARVMLSIGMIGSAVTSIFFGFTTSLLFLVLFWGANGFLQASGWSNCVKSMSQWFSQSERGTVMGLWCSCYQIGSVVAGVLAAYVLGHYGWRSAFFVPAVILLVIAAVYIIFHKDSPETVGLDPIEEYDEDKTRRGAEAESHAREIKSEPEESTGEVVRRVLSHPMVWLMGMSYFCLKFVRYSMIFWLPYYLTKKMGYTPEASGYYATLPEIAGFLGALFAGLVSDRLMGSRRAPICTLMFLGLAVAAYFQTHLCLMGILPMVIGLCVINFMIYGPDSIMTGAAAMDFGTRRGAATAAGFINGCGSIGSAIQEPLLGYLGLRFGYDYFFYIFIPLAIIPAILMLTQWNTRPDKS